MIDEKDLRVLCIRALRHYGSITGISVQDTVEAEKLLEFLSAQGNARKTISHALCHALASYLESLKKIEKFIISDPSFVGFDGANPLLMALEKEIGLALESKGQLCHDDIPKRAHSRIDW